MANIPNRPYLSPPSPHSIASNYYWSPDYVARDENNQIIKTGAWIPGILDSSGNLKVTIDGLIFSGSINVDNQDLENLTLTGIRYQSGVSGLLASVIVTGNAVGYNPSTGFQTMGRAVATDSFLPNYSSGGNAAVNIDKDNGGILVNQGALSKNIDSVVAWQTGTDIIASTTPFGNNPSGTNIVSGTLPINANRIGWFAQNLSTTAPLFIKFGSGLVNELNCNMVLNPASNFNEGGGSYSDQGTWRGSVVSSGRGKMILWEI